MTEEISAMEFARWKTHPVTMEVFRLVREKARLLKEFLGEGHTLRETAEQTQLETSRTVGRIEGLEQLLSLRWEEKEDELA